MRFTVEAWAPEYGAPVDPDMDPVSAQVDINVEQPAQTWAPRKPAPGADASCVLFIDGVRRIDARVWIDNANGAKLGICATYAAGVTRCDGRATVADVRVERGLFSAAPDAEGITTRHGRYGPRAANGETTEQLSLAVQQRMGELEAEVARACGEADLVVVDGPLRQTIANAVGYVKTHHVAYLPPVAEEVVGALGPGERTPLFLATTSWTRYSWYLRLPGANGHRWAGVVRCEAGANVSPSEAAALADRSAASLPRFASAAHKDPRAPQNLYPIAGLERELRRRSGDPQLMYRALLSAARAALEPARA